MLLTEDDYRSTINSYNIHHWKPLFELLHQIESTSQFGKMKIGEIDESGFMQMPYSVEADVISKFRNIVDELGICTPVDWTHIDELKQMAEDSTFDFDTVDVASKSMLIAYIIRKDRFSEGAVLSSFEKGMMPKILQSMKRQFMGK